MEEEPQPSPVKNIPKSSIGNQMSKILVDFDQEEPGEEIRLKGTSFSNLADQMIIKPNKTTGQKAKY